MLPNLSSFTNIYARINHFSDQEVDGITMVHDEQLQFDEIIELNKKIMESRFSDTSLSYRFSNYAIKQTASLVFHPSHGRIGVQVADVLAGFVMRYVQDRLSRNTELNLQQEQAFYDLSQFTNPELGLGINFVLADRDMERLGIGTTSNLRLDFIPPEVPGFPTEDDAK